MGVNQLQSRVARYIIEGRSNSFIRVKLGIGSKEYSTMLINSEFQDFQREIALGEEFIEIS